jgi:hypothetical protein
VLREYNPPRTFCTRPPETSFPSIFAFWYPIAATQMMAICSTRSASPIAMELCVPTARCQTSKAETDYGTGAMITPEQCEKFAEACENIAQRSSEEEKVTLREVALAWRELGEDMKAKQRKTTT